MKLSSVRPARLAKAMIMYVFLITPVALLSAQKAMTGPAPAAAPAGPSPISGLIVSIDGGAIVLSGTASGTARILLKADTQFFARQAATLASIKPGEALGVAADREADGSLAATAIKVFPPEIWQRARKGQFPMASGQVMTNAEVDRVVDKVEGRVVYLKYEMLSVAVSVPSNAEIRRTLPLKVADLTPGMRVSVRLAATTDGSLVAAMVSMDLPAK